MKNLFKVNLAIVIFTLAFTSCDKKEDPIDVDNFGTETVVDIDGNVYHTITIFNKTWMVENLNTTRFRNGDSIKNVTKSLEWGALSTSGCCDYNNDASLGAKYGKLYNWFAVNDSRNIAPNGWHVSTDSDWNSLRDSLINHGYNYDGLLTENYIAKSLASKTDWASFAGLGMIGNDLENNNRSGFRAKPSGCRYPNGSFSFMTYGGFWWSLNSTPTFWLLYYGYNNLSTNLILDSSLDTKSKLNGYSVRCVKD